MTKSIKPVDRFLHRQEHPRSKFAQGVALNLTAFYTRDYNNKNRTLRELQSTPGWSPQGGEPTMPFSRSAQANRLFNVVFTLSAFWLIGMGLSSLW